MNGVFSFLTGLVALVLLLLKKSDDNKNEREALKKEVYNAIDNGDLDTLNALIFHINKL